MFNLALPAMSGLCRSGLQLRHPGQEVVKSDSGTFPLILTLGGSGTGTFIASNLPTTQIPIANAHRI